MPDQQAVYENLVEVRSTRISRLDDAFEAAMADGDFIHAASMRKALAAGQFELALLDWRKGHDPRPRLQACVNAHESCVDVVLEHVLPRETVDLDTEGWNDHPANLAYVFLDRQSPMPWRGPNKNHRWPHYEMCFDLLANDHDLPDGHDALLKQGLENSELVDDCFRNYLEILGYLTTRDRLGTLAARGEALWLKRKTDRYFHGEDALEGHGDFNAHFVDFRLAAALKIAGWTGGGVHSWQWS